jgi:DNA-binding NarL/FixJ family response regulator
MYDDRTLVERALKNGANGYLLKETATDEIIHAIQEVYLDRYFLSPNISKYLEPVPNLPISVACTMHRQIRQIPSRLTASKLSTPALFPV